MIMYGCVMCIWIFVCVASMWLCGRCMYEFVYVVETVIVDMCVCMYVCASVVLHVYKYLYVCMVYLYPGIGICMYASTFVCDWLFGGRMLVVCASMFGWPDLFCAWLVHVHIYACVVTQAPVFVY